MVGLAAQDGGQVLERAIAAVQLVAIDKIRLAETEDPERRLAWTEAASRTTCRTSSLLDSSPSR